MRSRWLGCLLLITAAACGGAEDDPTGVPGGPGGGTAGAAGGTTAGTITNPIMGAPGGGITNPPSLGGTTAGGTTGGVAPAANGLPCDVQKILKDKCQTCHGEPLASGPMPLITWAHLQVASTLKPAEKIAQRVKTRIADTAMPMPPATRPQLTAAEKQTLNAYLMAGAPQSTASCTAGGTTAGTAGGTTAGTAGGTTAGGTTAGGTTGGGSAQCDVVMELRAHGAQTANDTTPFTAPSGGDHYEIFWFTPTWTEKMQVTEITPLIDNGSVLHHWLLYMKDSGTNPSGSHQMDSGLQSSDSALLSGWAPGNKNFKMPDDMGLQVVTGPSGRLGIEIHYNTGANPPMRQDRSGARLCLTKKLRPKEAATHWLGTQAIIGLGMFDAFGTCSVQKESHIIAHSPHMHKTGRYMKTIITKKAGGTVTLTDKPFSFDDQQIFPVDSPTGEVVVGPGDVIDTTCTYDAPGFMTFGPGTDSEMCYNFVIAWPVGSLSNGSPGLVGGKNTCIDGI